MASNCQNRKKSFDLFKQWGPSSQFLIGMNYLENKGHLWTSLSLKIAFKEQMHKNEFFPFACTVDELFEFVPKWLAQLFRYFEIPNYQVRNKDMAKGLLVCFVKEKIKFSTFCQLFTICVLKNIDLYIYDDSLKSRLGFLLESSFDIQTKDKFIELKFCNINNFYHKNQWSEVC